MDILQGSQVSESHHQRGSWRRAGKIFEHSRRTKWILITIAILIFILLCVSYLGYQRINRIKQEINAGQANLELAITAISGKPLDELGLVDFQEADRRLGVAENAFQKARSDLKPFYPFLKFFNGDIKASPHLLDLVLEATQSARDLYAGMLPILTEFTANAKNPLLYGKGAVEQFIALFVAGQPKLVDGRDHLANALAASQQIDRSGLSDKVAALVDKVDRILPRLYSAAEALAVMPDLLEDLFGLQEQKVYLLLSQNNDELRPTGGWIGTYGILVVSDGQITNSEYHSNLPPYPTPPDMACPATLPSWWVRLQKPVWACWDAQWTADFPTLAQQSEWFYDQGKNLYAPVDGVVAIDLTGAENLLKAIGPVEVDDYGVTVTDKNMRDLIYQYKIQGGEEPHKRLLASMFKAIIGNLVALLSEKTPAILKALWSSVQEKHLLFYFNSPGLESLITSAGADGGILPAQGDYLFVVDSSLTSKGYRSIVERIEYDATINSDGSLIGMATLNWFFPAEAVRNDPALSNDYRTVHGKPPAFLDISRIYIPQGSVWSGTDGNDSPTQFDEEKDRLMFGNQFVLAPGAGRQIQQHYLLPDLIQKIGSRSYYRLLIQKQPGTGAHELTVRITLPLGAELLSSSPKPTSVSDLPRRVVEFHTRLTADRTFEIVFR
jgi:hypothetical protein